MTERLGVRLGANLRGGETIALQSDLGGGKTTFVRGLAAGIGSQDHVASPTFTISREYRSMTTGLTIYHFDFYRLQDAGIVANELSEAAEDPQAIIVVEWGEIVKETLADNKLMITILPTSDTSRKFTLSFPQSLEYVVQGIDG